MKICLKHGCSTLVTYPWLKNKTYWAIEENGTEYVRLIDPEAPTGWGGELMIHKQEIDLWYDDTFYVTTSIPVGSCASVSTQSVTLTLPAVANATGYTIYTNSNQPVTASNRAGVKIGSGLAFSNDGVLSMGSSVAQSGDFSDLEGEGGGCCDDEGEKLPDITEIGLGDLSVSFSAKPHQLKTRRVDVDMEHPFWIAFQGLADVLDGLHLKFFETDQTIDADGFDAEPCMLLASVKDVEFYTPERGRYVAELLGTMIPTRFLKA